MLNPTLPTKHKITLIRLLSSGVISGIIVKNNIPTPIAIRSDSHNFCLATMLASTYFYYEN